MIALLIQYIEKSRGRRYELQTAVAYQPHWMAAGRRRTHGCEFTRFIMTPWDSCGISNIDRLVKLKR